MVADNGGEAGESLPQPWGTNFSLVGRGQPFSFLLTARHGRIIPLLWVYTELQYRVLGCGCPALDAFSRVGSCFDFLYPQD